jgi:hypothetical protein
MVREGAGFEPGTAALQSGALTLGCLATMPPSHFATCWGYRDNLHNGRRYRNNKHGRGVILITCFIGRSFLIIRITGEGEVFHIMHHEGGVVS